MRDPWSVFANLHTLHGCSIPWHLKTQSIWRLHDRKMVQWSLEVSQNCSAGSRSRSSWNFSTALPLSHLSVSGSCFIAVKCYSFSPRPGDRLHFHDRGRGQLGRVLQSVLWGDIWSFAQPHPQVTARLPPEGGVHIVGVREQCPKSNIVARRRNGRGRLLQRGGATRLVVRPMVARSADDRRGGGSPVRRGAGVNCRCK